MRHFRPAGDFLAQNFQRRRLGIGRIDDEGVRQRVARQAGDNIGHAFAGLHALERLFLRHETPLAGRRLLQAVFNFTDILAAGVERHEQTELLHAGGIAPEIAQVVEQHVAKTGQGQRDADDEQRQQGIERRRPQTPKRRREGSLMLGKPGVHATNLP